MSFTGQTGPPLLHLTPNDPTAPGVQYMNIVYSVDDWELIELPILSNTTTLVLTPTPSGPLNKTAVHTLVVMIYNSKQGDNRWSAPFAPRGAGLLVRGVELEDGAVAIARDDLAPKRCLIYGDSITEGVEAQCHPASDCTIGGDLCGNSATKTWGRAVAAAFDCEYSQVGFGSLGWTVGGGGGVVPVFTPGDPSQSSWNQIYDGAPRTFENIDYVFILHATNDGLRQKGTPASVAAVTESVHGWLEAIRNAVGAETHVFLTVPFGGFGAAQEPIGALKAGFDLYQGIADTAAPKDTRTHYIDLGPAAARGLTHFGIHSIESCGGIHPRGGTRYSARHGELGAMLAVKATLAIASVP
jgi:hypothetical protein